MKNSIENIVGKANDEERDEWFDYFSHEFKTQENVYDFYEVDKEDEIEKTPEQKKVIDLANKLISEEEILVTGTGKFNISPNNIHIFSKGKWDEIHKKRGGIDNIAEYSFFTQSIAMYEEKLLIDFFHKAMHEMVHFASFQSIKLEEDKELKEKMPDLYRTGLIVFSKNGGQSNFYNLNEAVTEMVNVNLFKKGISDPIFSDYVKRFELMKDIFSYKGKSLIGDNTYYAEVIGKDPNIIRKEVKDQTLDENKIKNDVSVDNISTNTAISDGKNLAYNGKKVLYVVNEHRFGAISPRSYFDKLADKLYLKNTDKFKDVKEVKDIFEKALFDGNILPPARLIDETFGSGTFRKLGELDIKPKSIDEQKYIMNSLNSIVENF